MTTAGLIILKHCLSILCCKSLHVDFHFRCFQETEDVVFVKEVNLKDKLNKVCNSIDVMSVVVDLGGCSLKYFALGDSMALGKQVCSFVINCLCRKFFMDERPTVSRKHYFVSSISEVFMSDLPDYSYVEKCFSGAASVLILPLCDELFFPVLHGKHWFLFVVDLKNKMFIILDWYYSKDDGFCVYTRNKLKKSFCHAWAMYVGLDPGFNNFRTCYAHVPKQANQ
ncbi:unnamed protein product [Miscanthus lutarioriparius]|uniref:Ubiquitin-like protease family profile domain-containing protein n=1 Tax=Miscanthus lutarioriparius TaxID=422564 RepID=A0A811MHZ1_9POAL|nr:unnamed protein product [Miscanthus lutarioriparius]